VTAVANSQLSTHERLSGTHRIEYNTLRPHSALGYLTPTDYANTWTANHPELS
jgi:transposase InsO family protein